MSYTLTVDLPNLPVGGALIIDGLGEFINGDSVDISDEDANLYQARQAKVVSEYDEVGQLHTSVEVGPTLAEVFKDHPFITVTTTPVVAVAAKTVVPPSIVTPAATDSGKEVN